MCVPRAPDSPPMQRCARSAILRACFPRVVQASERLMGMKILNIIGREGGAMSRRVDDPGRVDEIEGQVSITPNSPRRTPQPSLTRLAAHLSSPGCVWRENPGPRAHRGRRQRAAALPLLRLSCAALLPTVGRTAFELYVESEADRWRKPQLRIEKGSDPGGVGRGSARNVLRFASARVSCAACRVRPGSRRGRGVLQS